MYHLRSKWALTSRQVIFALCSLAHIPIILHPYPQSPLDISTILTALALSKIYTDHKTKVKSPSSFLVNYRWSTLGDLEILFPFPPTLYL